MAQALRAAASVADNPMTALIDLQTLTGFGDAVLQVQRMQLEALLTWQQSLASMQQELWDGWVCRWGGGVPIDG